MNNTRKIPLVSLSSTVCSPPTRPRGQHPQLGPRKVLCAKEGRRVESANIDKPPNEPLPPMKKTVARKTGAESKKKIILLFLLLLYFIYFLLIYYFYNFLILFFFLFFLAIKKPSLLLLPLHRILSLPVILLICSCPRKTLSNTLSHQPPTLLQVS